MALLTCPDCSGKVSSEASNCPHCGRPAPRPAAAPLQITPSGDSLVVNRDRDATFNLCLQAIQRTGLKHSVVPDGILLQGKAFGHNGAALGIVIAGTTSEGTYISFSNETSHFGPGVGRLTKDFVHALEGVAGEPR